MDLISIYKQTLAVIAQLAPLSVLIAALTYLNNLRQARIRREIDEVTALREVFSRLGIKSNLLSWSLIGNSLITAAVLQIRESIETRLGNNPSVEDFRLFISDQLLFEAIAGKAIQQRRDKRNDSNRLEQSGIYILQTFKNRSNYSSLKEATEVFLKSYFSELLEDSESVFTLLYIRSKGVEDPDIDIFLASITGNVQLLESACN